MSYTGKYITFDDFSGGYAANISFEQLTTKQAYELDNIVLLPQARGFRTRHGNSKINTSAFNSGATWQGLGYFLTAAGSEFLVGVAGTKFGTNASFGTSFTDSTGSITITSGQTNLWDLFTYNDQVIGFGGSPTSPDAPFKWTGSGNASALGGTSPSAYGGLTANNRVFAFRTSAAPSTLYWSVLGSASDFAGTGSGSAVIGSLNDNQKLTGVIVQNTNYMLAFKEGATYQVNITTAPFPSYTLFPTVGCAGKKAAINVDGEVYWINQWGRMVSTDGQTLKTYPIEADDLWNAVDPTYYSQIKAFREVGVDHDWLCWSVRPTATSTNDRIIVWDLQNKCWLRCRSGYAKNAFTTDAVGRVYMGGYDGFVYKPDQTGIYVDADGVAAAISASWQSGWMKGTSIDEVVQVRTFGVLYTTKASGSMTIAYGFNFIEQSKNFTVSQVPTSTEVEASFRTQVTGRGNFFNFRWTFSSATIDCAVKQFVLGGKVAGQKRFAAP